jgi:hypothetical protein
MEGRLQLRAGGQRKSRRTVGHEWSDSGWHLERQATAVLGAVCLVVLPADITLPAGPPTIRWNKLIRKVGSREVERT